MEVKKTPVFFLDEVAKLEESHREKHKLAYPELMSIAVSSIFQEYRNFFREYHTVILSGSGNNGGDGLALAFFLDAQGYSFEVFWLEKNPKPETSIYAKRCKEEGVSIQDLKEFLYWEPDKTTKPIFFVDAILGSGSKGELTGIYSEVVSKLNQWKTSLQDSKILSIDFPTGFSSNQEVNCDFLAEIGSRKIELLEFAPEESNKRSFHAIGTKARNPEQFLLEKLSNDDTIQLLNRKDYGHKYTSGACTFLGGDHPYAGALWISVKSFHKLGGGISFAFSKDSQTVSFLHERDSSLLVSLEEEAPIKQALQKSKCLVMGMGTTDSHSIPNFLEGISIPVVIDAGMVTQFFQKPFASKSEILLTPHTGELKSACKNSNGKFTDREITKENKFDIGKTISEKLNAWIFWKDKIPCLFSPNGELFFWNSPNPLLSVMGTGDMLAGVLGKCLSVGHSVLESVQISMSILSNSKVEISYPTVSELIDSWSLHG